MTKLLHYTHSLSKGEGNLKFVFFLMSQLDSQFQAFHQ